jgi:uncharacterized protein (TIGR02145 family)
MIIVKKPQFLMASYNPIDLVVNYGTSFTSIVSEFVVRNKVSDNPVSIKRLNIYNDDILKYNLSDFVSSYHPRILTSNTFSYKQYSIDDQVNGYLSIIDTGGVPLIINWQYVFNGVYDRNESIDYDATTLLNKPLLSGKQKFIPTEYGQLNIFNGEYNDQSDTDKHTYEYININTDKNNDSSFNDIYSTGGISTTTYDITINDGYLYNYQMATAMVGGKYVIARSTQPNGKNGWRVPSREDWFELRDTIDPTSPSGVFGNNNNNAGISLKYNSLWAANAGTNESKFSAMPSGFLLNNIFVNNATYFGGGSGSPVTANTTARFMTTTEVDGDPDNIWYAILSSANNHLNVFGENQGNKYFGYSIRLVRDAVVGDIDFDPEGYVGNNGFIYPTVKVGDQVWLASNLQEFVFDTSETPPNLANHKGSLSQWNDYTNLGYGFTYYSSDSLTNTCVTSVGFSYPCSFGGNPVTVRPVDFSYTIGNIIDPILNPNKVYRYYNEVYENNTLFPVSRLRYDVSNYPIFSNNTGMSKMISNPIYPASINLSNNIGYMLDVEANLTIEVKDVSRYKVGDELIIRWEELINNSVEKLRHYTTPKVIESIDYENNIIVFTYTLVDTTPYVKENFKCILFDKTESILVRPKRTEATIKLTYSNREVEGNTEDVLVVEIENIYCSNILNYSILHLMEDYEIIGEKLYIDGYYTTDDDKVYLYTRNVATTPIKNHIDSNVNKEYNIIINDEIVFEDLDYTNYYDVYTTKQVWNNIDTNLYHEVLSSEYRFELFNGCGRNEIVQLGYINKWGAVEYLLFNKKRVDAREITRLSMRKPLSIGDRNKYDEELYNYNTNVEYVGEINSDWLDEYEYGRCLDLLESTKVFEVKDGYELPIVVQNTEVIERNIKNDKLFNITIEYRRTYNKKIQR